MSRASLFNSLGCRDSGDKNADRESVSSINHLSSSYLQSVLSTTLPSTGSTTKTTGNGISGIGVASDNRQLSPFAQLMIAFQQLQQSDPANYQQVTQQIATNLQGAAQTAQADGNSAAANQLNQLATDFTSASTSGQLPNMQDLAQAIFGHHHHHHHVCAASGDQDGNSSAGSSTSGNSSSSSASQALSQILSSFQVNGTQSDSLNPMAIIV